MPNIDFNKSMNPIEYSRIAKHRAITNAKMIVFFYSALLINVDL